MLVPNTEVPFRVLTPELGPIFCRKDHLKLCAWEVASPDCGAMNRMVDRVTDLMGLLTVAEVSSTKLCGTEREIKVPLSPVKWKKSGMWERPSPKSQLGNGLDGPLSSFTRSTNMAFSWTYGISLQSRMPKLSLL